MGRPKGIKRPNGPGVQRNPLTQLELNTLQMLSEGFKPRELVRSCENYHTVQARMHRMRLKLDAFTTAHMVAIGLKKGLIK